MDDYDNLAPGKPTVDVKVTIGIRAINGGFITTVNKSGKDEKGRYAYSTDEVFSATLADVARTVEGALA